VTTAGGQGLELSEKKRELLEALLQEAGLEPREGRIPKRAVDGPLPLSFAQQRLWFFDQWEPGSVAYNLPSALRLQGRLDRSALERAFNEILRRHEVLRTAFGLVHDAPVQIVHKAERRELEVVDLRNTPPGARYEAAHRISAEQASHRFDLSCGPLVVAKLLQLDDLDHVLIITMHHIISDGWSIKVFIREAGVLYDAYCSSRESPLPELEIQYADFAIWQREQLRGEVLERHLEYWKRQLLDRPAVLELPIDRPRPLVRSSSGQVMPFALPLGATSDLAELSLCEGATLFMTLLAAFNVLLYRYSGQEDILVGSPIANRNRAELESLMGFFVNTLVIRTDLSGGPTFQEVLGRVKDVALEAYAHQDLPFEKLVEELEPERSLSHTPVFQVLFHVQNAVTERLKLSGLTVSPFETEDNTAKFDLSFTMTEDEARLTGNINYNSDLFDGATIERMIRHFQKLIESIIANPEQKISRIELLDRDERRLITGAWNATAVEYPRDKSIVEVFQEQVEGNPDSVAICFKEATLTYRELNRRANRLAHYLRELGVGTETTVAVCLERRPELIVGMLGILKAGASYLPLEPGFPRQRLKTMIDAARARVLLTQKQLTDLLPEAATTLRLAEDWQAVAKCSAYNLAELPGPENLAYVMYTSGSTGIPKGIAVPHRGVVRLLCGTDYVPFGRNEVFLQMAPAGFDASTFEIWGALLHGASCVLADGDAAAVDQIRRVIANRQITIAWLTSSLFNSIIDQDAQALAGLKRLLIGGERLSVRHVREAQQCLPGTRIVNGYGPTEDTTFTCCYVIDGDRENYHRGVPIGAPIANTRVYVLDKEMNPVPIGVTGEMYAGGDGLARGYLGQPGLTAEAFLPDEYSGPPGNRLYRTGDLVRYRADGKIEFIGRTDTQIKLRGYRVEIEEVENALATCPQVRQCAVELKENHLRERELVAYVAPARYGEVSERDLRSHLKDILPDYMVPAWFVLLEALPLSPRGKIDRNALPDPRRGRTTRTAFVEPRNVVEEVLASMAAGVLGVEQVGVQDNFFEIGGHSLLATQLVNQVRRTFYVEFPLRVFFEEPTVAALCAIVTSGNGRQAQAEKIAALRKQIEGLSSRQLEELLKQKKIDQDLTERRDSVSSR
jgi:amino acid adenylation domain-containing protein